MKKQKRNICKCGAACWRKQCLPCYQLHCKSTPWHHPLFHIWNGIKHRCRNPKCKQFFRYGARGINICDRWHDSFDEFCSGLLAEIGERPSKKHSLDRFPDNNGNYEPGNVRWATAKQQAANRRDTVFITIFGETKCVTDWADDPRCEVAYDCFKWRVAQGMDPEIAMTLPLGTVTAPMKSHCKNGHEFSAENMRPYTNPRSGYSQRICRACERESHS